jgi:glycosyltransferase involved in cell wall biosynthesis
MYKMGERILVLGYFGYSNNQFDGQTVKTRNIYELLLLKTGNKEDIDFFDTQRFKHLNLSFFLNMIWKIFRCNKLIYIPAHNNLKYLFPLIYIICKLKRIDIFYIVVGGWLADYLKKKWLHIILLSNIRAIFPQSDQLSLLLREQYQFKNVITFPNFRIHSFKPFISDHKDVFKIVYMARINRMKGIDYVFRLADYFINIPFCEKPVIIDFYGPIDENDKTYFYEQMDKYAITFYKGILQPDKIYDTLNNYDLMVLPTKYYTEGFPGSILDAYISGIPVIVTNWKYAREFVDDGKTGIIVPFENGEKEFINAVLKLYQDYDLLIKMKYNAYEKSKFYSSENAWEILKKIW